MHGRMHKIYPDDAHRFLLFYIILIQQANMQDDVIGFLPGCALKANAHPAQTILLPTETAGGHRIGKHKKARFSTALGSQPFVQQPVLVFEHVMQAFLTNITARLAINRIAHRHVIGAHALGHRPGRAADTKEPPRHFLASANLGKGAVLVAVEIDRLRFLRGAEARLLHRLLLRHYLVQKTLDLRGLFPVPRPDLDPARSSFGTVRETAIRAVLQTACRNP